MDFIAPFISTAKRENYQPNQLYQSGLSAQGTGA
jgi:hypothetical protein